MKNSAGGSEDCWYWFSFFQDLRSVDPKAVDPDCHPVEAGDGNACWSPIRYCFELPPNGLHASDATVNDTASGAGVRVCTVSAGIVAVTGTGTGDGEVVARGSGFCVGSGSVC